MAVKSVKLWIWDVPCCFNVFKYGFKACQNYLNVYQVYLPTSLIKLESSPPSSSATSSRILLLEDFWSSEVSASATAGSVTFLPGEFPISSLGISLVPIRRQTILVKLQSSSGFQIVFRTSKSLQKSEKSSTSSKFVSFKWSLMLVNPSLIIILNEKIGSDKCR